MVSLLPFFVFLHVLAISAWIAAVLWVSGDVKRTVVLGRPHVDALASRIRPAFGLDSVAAIATFASGILIMWGQGFVAPRAGVSAGIVLAIVRGAVLASLRRSVRAVIGRAQAGETVSPGEPVVRRMGMLSGIAHLLWLLALAGMVFPV